MAAVVTLQMRLNVYCSLGWRVPTPTHPVVGAWWKPCRSSPSWHHRRTCLRSCGRLRSGVPAWTPIIAQDDRAMIWVECGRLAAADHHPGPAIDGDSSEHHLLQRVFPYVLAHAVLVPVI